VPDVALEGLALTAVGARDRGARAPRSVTEGDSFVEAEWGDTPGPDRDRRRRRGRGRPAGELRRLHHLTATVDDAVLAGLGADVAAVEFVGDAVVEVVSAVDGETYRTAPLPVTLGGRAVAGPAGRLLENSGVIFVNDELEVAGDGFLLGGGEGQTRGRGPPAVHARPARAPARPVAEQVVPVIPAVAVRRDRGTFRFVPAIAGIRGGSFTGTVTIENRPVVAGAAAGRGAVDVAYDLVTAQIFRSSRPGQPGPVRRDQRRRLRRRRGRRDDRGAAAVGTFTPTGAPGGRAVDLVLIPEFVAGERVRYVINTDDALGQAIDLRTVTGSFRARSGRSSATAATPSPGRPPRSRSASRRSSRSSTSTSARATSRALRGFGLRAVDAAIRPGCSTWCAPRTPGSTSSSAPRRPPTSRCSRWSRSTAPIPTAWGCSATTTPRARTTATSGCTTGWAGSTPPPSRTASPATAGCSSSRSWASRSTPARGESLPGADPLFDQIFDPFRPDRGDIIVAADLAGGAPTIDGSACPASGAAIASPARCGPWARSSARPWPTRSATASGLANPGGDGFHNAGDEVNRLMDAGGDRSVPRARHPAGRQGPAVFCDGEYDYLRQILPSAQAPDTGPRPPC
jgi:hypothetical protein